LRINKWVIGGGKIVIRENYAAIDPETGREYLTFEDGTRSYFLERLPKTIAFQSNDQDQTDQYAHLYSSPVVNAVNALKLPR
jgi:hypothetical protein